MRHRKKRSPLFPILFLALLCLTGSLLLLLPTQSVMPMTDKTENVIFPTTFLVEIEGLNFSTPSATLLKTHGIQQETLLSKFIQTWISSPSDKRSSYFDQNAVRDWLATLSSRVEQMDEKPTVLFAKDGKTFTILSGERGKHLNIETATATILAQDLQATNSAKIQLEETGTKLTPDALIEAKRFVGNLIGKSLEIRAPHFSQKLQARDLAALLSLPDSFSQDAMNNLSQTLNQQIGTAPVEPVLEINGTTVEKFVAPKDGRQVDSPELSRLVWQQILALQTQPSVDPVSIPLITQKPTHSLSSVNQLGISERIGLGDSEYQHSIPNRVHNVALTTSKIHAKLVQPGEEFSFNKYLGEVSAVTGFKPAYVIKQGQTVLGDGGGVCQVSSTLFRALLNAGLPITERKGHSYRVGYYEQNSKPGFDATVFSPHPDLRFLNDTGNVILINAVADSKTLSMYIELWGKSDGRTAVVENYKQWGASPAPPAVYQDDPTLAPGKIKQIDFAAPGLKTSFDYVVTYPDGQKKMKTFQTTYTPWAAIYLRGI